MSSSLPLRFRLFGKQRKPRILTRAGPSEHGRIYSVRYITVNKIESVTKAFRQRVVKKMLSVATDITFQNSLTSPDKYDRLKDATEFSVRL